MSDIDRRETAGTVEVAVELTAAVWFAGAVGYVAYNISKVGLEEVVALGFVAMIIALGEQIRVRITGVQEHAPVAEGAALALATTPTFGIGTDVNLSPPVLIVAVCVGTLAGCMVHSARSGIPTDLYYLALRVHVVTVAAIMFRWLPLVNGETLATVSSRAADSPWLATGIITWMILIAITMGLILGGLQRSSSAGVRIGALMRDEIVVLWYLHLTTAITALSMALGARVLGPWSYLAMAMPLVLVQFAMQRTEAVQETKRQMVRALSKLPEVGGYVGSGHVARVAELATGIGRVLGLSERELLELEHAAQLHDVGQVGLRIPLPGGATVEAAPRDQQAIASNGARILAEAGDAPSILTIVDMQAASYRRMAELGEEIPLAARIIKVVNAFDDFSQGRRDARFRETAVERLSLGLGYEYDPQVFQALIRVLRTPEQPRRVRRLRGLGRLDHRRQKSAPEPDETAL